MNLTPELTKIIAASNPKAAFHESIIDLLKLQFVPDSYAQLVELNHKVAQHFAPPPQELVVQADGVAGSILTLNGKRVNYLWHGGERLFAVPDICHAVGSLHLGSKLTTGFFIKRKMFGYRVPITFVPIEAIRVIAAKAYVGNYEPFLDVIDGRIKKVHLSVQALSHIKWIWYNLPDAKDRLEITKSALDLIATLDPI
jgi:hypothetical protein